MLKNYLKVAIRNILRNKSYSIINIAGLAVGLACCILIMLWVFDELSYDRFHENADRLFRITKENMDKPGVRSAITPLPLGPELKQEFPEIITAARFSIEGPTLIKYGETKFQDDIVAIADPEFLEMFSFHLVDGDSSQALSDMFSVIISREMQEKYFGDSNPIGEILNIDRRDFKITGVFDDIPEASHMQFDCLTPFESIPDHYKKVLNNWRVSAYYNYVMLHESASPDMVSAKIAGVIDKHNPGREHSTRLALQSITDIHLYRDVSDYLKNQGNIKYIYLFTTLVLLILLVACINFMNLATARSGIRAREIGVRKAIGASRKNLILQFYGESLSLVLIAFFTSILLVELFLPIFNAWAGKQLSLSHQDNLLILFGAVGLIFITGILAGSYPALFLSSFNPDRVLRGGPERSKRGLTFRRLLVAVQFAFSIFLIAAVVIIYRQLDYISHKDLGYDKDEIVYVLMRGDFAANYEHIRSELLQSSEFLDITGGLPPTELFDPAISVSWERKPETGSDEEIIWQSAPVAENYIEAFGMEIIDGRSFMHHAPTGDAAGFVLNETAAKMMGVGSQVGRNISFGSYEGDVEPTIHEGVIIGIVRDFHNVSLYDNIGPVILRSNPSALFYMAARIKSGSAEMAIKKLQAKWNEYVPEYPIEYNFLDETIDNYYDSERRLGAVVAWSASLAIFLSCLGLYGLSSFMAEQKRKEIGIRKVLGASLSNILGLLTKDIFVLTVISIIVAWPTAYFFLNHWLQNFAYRINIGWAVLITSWIIALIIALMTAGFQAFRAARTNPVESLKYE